MIILALTFLLLAAGESETENPASARLDAACGDYVVVGREPAGGAAYAGTARIERVGHRLNLHRKVGNGPAMILQGMLEPALGGEAEVFRFRGPDGAPRTLTCLDQGDLDNYLRFTCIWTYDAKPQPSEPGLEALFPTAAWPDNAPRKNFDAHGGSSLPSAGSDLRSSVVALRH